MSTVVLRVEGRISPKVDTELVEAYEKLELEQIEFNTVLNHPEKERFESLSSSVKLGYPAQEN